MPCDLRDGYIAIRNMATGHVTRLDASLIPGSYQCCNGLYAPRWSADGTRLVFAKAPFTNFTINADGNGLRQLGLVEQGGMLPSWSPVGSTIVSARDADDPAIYIDYPDGGQRTVVHDASRPGWTRDGRIAFVKRPWLGNTWLMDRDGGNQLSTDGTIAELSRAGCTVCPFTDDGGPLVGLWQPTP